MFALKRFDYLFGIFILILMSNGFISLLTSDFEDLLSTRESSLLVSLLLGCYLYFFLRSMLFYKTVILYLSKSIAVIFFMVYLIFNAFHSEYTPFALQKVVALILTIYVSICFCILYSKKEFIEIMLVSLLVLLTSSLLFGVLLPDYGIHSDEFHENSWRGVFPQKQVLGQIALLGLLFSVVFRSSIKVNFYYSLLFLSIVLLFLCQSRTAWIVGIICLAFYKYFSAKRLFKSELKAAVGLSLLFLLIALFYHIYLNFVEVLDLLGKDATLTGRSTLWEYTLDVARENRLFGVGYKSFWQNQSDLMFIYFGYFAVNGHNFILDSYLEIGIIGITLISCIFYVKIKNTFSENDGDKQLWSLLLLLYIVLVGQVATIFPNQNSIVTFLFFTSYYGLIRHESRRLLPDRKAG